MHQLAFAVIAALAILLPGPVEALVMCGPSRPDGTLREGAPIRLRTSCKPREIQIDPVALGLQGPEGTAGPVGPEGPQGPTGPAGPSPIDLSARVATSGPVPIPGGPPFFSEAAASFGTELWDTNGFHTAAAPTRLTIVEPGKYMVYGHVEFLPGGLDNGLHVIRIVANGTTTLTSSSIPDAGNNERLSLATHYELAAGDYVELLAAANLCCYGEVGATFNAEFGLARLP